MNRDPQLWRRVASHPGVEPFIIGQGTWDIADIVSHPRVLPFANAHGGFLFFALDVIGSVFEVHAMMEPCGRGYEAWALAVNSFEHMFSDRCRVMIAQEVAFNPMSRAPRTFGFELAGEWVGHYRPWVLTRDKWFASPSRQRMKKCLLS